MHSCLAPDYYSQTCLRGVLITCMRYHASSKVWAC